MNIRLPVLALSLGLAMTGCDSGSETVEPPAPSTDRTQLTVDLSGFPEAARERANALIEAVNTAPDDAESAALAGMFAHAYERPQLAVQYYTLASELASDPSAWAYLRGVVLMDEGRDAEAMAAFDEAIAAGMDYPPMQLRRAQLLAKAGSSDEARSLLAGVVEQASGYAKARYHLGKLAVDAGDLDVGIEQLSQAVQLTPHYGAAHYALAAAYEANNQADLATTHRALFEKHQRGAPPNSDRFLTRVQDMRRSPQQAIIRAGRLSAAGKFAEAAAVFEELLVAQPDNVVAHTNLVGLYGQLGQIDKARAAYAAGVAVSPDVAPLQSNFGILMLREGDYDAALGAFDKAIEADPAIGSAHRYRGIALQRKGDSDAALTSFQKAFDVDPYDFQAGYLIGNSLIAKGQYDDAAASFERIVEPVSQRTPAYLRGLAMANFNAGDMDSAADALNRARVIAVDYGQTAVVAEIDAELAQLAEGNVATP